MDLIRETARIATRNPEQYLDQLSSRLNHEDQSVRFWAATAFSIHTDVNRQIREKLLDLTDDSSPAVRTAAAEALYRNGDKERALQVLGGVLDENHPFAILRALNTIEVLDIPRLPDFLTDKLKSDRIAEHEYNKYVRRASSWILDNKE